MTVEPRVKNDYSFAGRDGSFLSRETRVISAAAATLAVKGSQHADKTVALDRAAGGVTATLPPAMGTGNRYRFTVGTALASGSYIIQTANALDYMRGQVLVLQDAGSTVLAFETANTATVATETDTITMDGSTQGGAIGDTIELEDFKIGVWALRGILTGTGTEATPLSVAV